MLKLQLESLPILIYWQHSPVPRRRHIELIHTRTLSFVKRNQTRQRFIIGELDEHRLHEYEGCYGQFRVKFAGQLTE